MHGPRRISEEMLTPMGTRVHPGTRGYPRFLCDKTLFSSTFIGLGIQHLPTRWPHRVLDMADRAVRLVPDPQVADPLVRHLLVTMRDAAAQLGASMDIDLPLDDGPQASPLDNATISLLLCPVPTAALETDTIFTDGSFDGAKCAGAVLTPQGECYGIRPPGLPSSYKAELHALGLACEMAGPDFVIKTDSLAAIKAIQGTSARVTMGALVELARMYIATKRLTLVHVPGHTGIAGNEMADTAARQANTELADPAPPIPWQAWDVIADGEIFRSPHKIWAARRTPQHKPRDIHPVSWKPIGRPGWFRWLTGCIGRHAPPALLRQMTT